MYYLTKKSGRFDELSKQALDNLPDGEYTLEKKKKRRSTEQNAYLHGVILPKIREFFLDMGYDYSIVDIKDWLKSREFFGYREFGKELIPNHTSGLTTLEFMAAKEKIQQYFAEKNCIIPDPNQEDFLEGT